MELPEFISEILKYVGAPTIAGGIFWFFYKAGALLEENTSEQSHTDFASYLKSGRLVGSIMRIPTGTRRCFEAVFGRRHISLKCVTVSACITIAIAVVLFAAAIIHYPDFALDLEFDELTIVTLAIVISRMILIDYVSLYRTRLLTAVIEDGYVKGSFTMLVLVGVDYLVAYLIFILTLFGSNWITTFAFKTLGYDDTYPGIEQLWLMFEDFPLWHPPFRNDGSLLPMMFFASLVPSIWLWAYVMAILITRLMGRSRRLFSLLSYLLPLDTHPIRSVGLVSAILASVGYLMVWVVPV